MKVLILDIETTAQEGYFYGKKWETNIIEIFEQSRILSFSAKWLNSKQVTFGWPDYKGYKKGVKDDKSIVHHLWEIIDYADVVVGQNIKAFDLKTINARFAFHKLPPPSPYKVIDTLTETKKAFRLPSNKLDDIGAYFDMGRKTEHEGFPLWLKCVEGDMKAWKKMKKYNAQDVLLTEKQYLLLLPWMKVNTFAGQTCPKCGSANLHSRGFYFTRTARYRKMNCLDCMSWMRAPEKEKLPKPMESI